MYPLLESIRLVDGQLYNIPYHQMRMNYSYLNYYDKHCTLHLKEILKEVQLPQSGIFKIRFLYNNDTYDVEIHEYIPKKIKTIQLVFDDYIHYPLKFTERTPINNLLQLKNKCDDILIVRHHKITDSSYTNIILRGKDEIWYTPESCLLKGTQRASLIRENRLIVKDISVADLHDYTHFMLINSMMPPQIDNIQPIHHIKL